MTYAAPRFSRLLHDAHYWAVCASQTSGFTTTDCRPPSCNRGRSRDLSWWRAAFLLGVIATRLIGSARNGGARFNCARYISVTKYKTIWRETRREKKNSNDRFCGSRYSTRVVALTRDIFARTRAYRLLHSNISVMKDFNNTVRQLRGHRYGLFRKYLIVYFHV